MSFIQLQAVPFEHTPNTSANPRYIRRGHVSPEFLRTQKLLAGDWVKLMGESKALILQLWPRVGVAEGDVLLVAEVLDTLASRRVILQRWDPSKLSAGILRSVTLEESTHGDGKIEKAEVLQEGRENDWIKAVLKENLVATKYISKTHAVSLSEAGASSRVFRIKEFEVSTKSTKKGSPDISQLTNGLSKLNVDQSDFPFYEIDWRTRIHLHEPPSQPGSSTDRIRNTTGTKSTPNSSTPSYINLYTPNTTTNDSTYSQLGGLAPQIAQIKSLLDLPLLHPELYTLFNLTPPKGILLHGPPGTGKTALARAIASSNPSCSCIVVNGPELSSAYHGESEERLRGVFEEAGRRSPCIVVIDEIDALCPRRDGDGGEVEKRMVATLLTILDGVGRVEAERVFVIGATNRPNSIDPALRRPGRFDREIEIGIPDASGRKEIIDILVSKMPHDLTAEDISSLAARTHGYVGADLSSLIRESASSAIQRWHTTFPKPASPTLTNVDILTVLPSIRPSAMREVFVETPTVRWSDIGGQEEVKAKLKECVEWPLTHRDTFKRLGVEAPRGVLLYGPPGCSKTMTAKTLATESGLNFIAVKGPELLNKYVGESERAVREIFRKARAASPSIVFFDEIDALGSSRTDDLAHSGVLTSLLNEMDGIEELSGVTVVAATNRPDVLDSALMRPGRLDRILYVGAPDLVTRRDIFRIRLSNMAVEPGIDVDELAQVTDGCSGAEVASICQDAALATMNEDLEAPFVKRAHLLHSAKTVRRRITPSMLQFFAEWRDQSGVRSA